MFHLLANNVIVLSLFLSPSKKKEGERKRERTVQNVANCNSPNNLGQYNINWKMGTLILLTSHKENEGQRQLEISIILE